MALKGRLRHLKVTPSSSNRREMFLRGESFFLEKYDTKKQTDRQTYLCKSIDIEYGFLEFCPDVKKFML